MAKKFLVKGGKFVKTGESFIKVDEFNGNTLLKNSDGKLIQIGGGLITPPVIEMINFSISITVTDNATFIDQKTYNLQSPKGMLWKDFYASDYNPGTIENEIRIEKSGSIFSITHGFYFDTYITNLGYNRDGFDRYQELYEGLSMSCSLIIKD